MIFGKKEWVSEISGIFFSTLAEKKIQHYFSPRKKYRVIFPQNCRFQTEKNNIIFLCFRPPYFCQNCEFQLKKPTSYLGQNWGSQTEIKRYRPYFSKNCVFQAEVKNTYYFCQNRQEILPKKIKYRDHRKGVSQCIQYLFQGKKYHTFGSTFNASPENTLTTLKLEKKRGTNSPYPFSKHWFDKFIFNNIIVRRIWTK